MECLKEMEDGAVVHGWAHSKFQVQFHGREGKKYNFAVHLGYVLELSNFTSKNYFTGKMIFYHVTGKKYFYR